MAILTRQLGLTGRSITFSLLMLSVTVISLSTALIWRSHIEAMSALRRHAITYTRAMGLSAELNLLLNDKEALQHKALAAASDESVLCAAFYNAEKKMLTHLHEHQKIELDVDSDKELAHLLSQPIDRQSYHIEQMDTWLLVIMPVWAETSDKIEIDLLVDEESSTDSAEERPVGYVCLTYDLEPAYAKLRSNILSSAAIAVVVILIGTVITILIVRQLLTPVRNLAATTTAIADGDLSRRAGEQAVGEVGDLAKAFNHMADTLAQYTGNLETQVQERTSELRRAMEEAEEANQLKSDFLANMSHEIRTPMTAILGFTETLLDESTSESERTQMADTIRRNGEHLMQLINDILDISKIESGRLELERLECSPCQIIAEVASTMRQRAKGKGIDLKVEYAGAIPVTIRTDPMRLRQALINLVGNAVKFTELGSLTIRTGLNGSQEEPQLFVEVIDTGIGIPPDRVDAVLEPFKQADTSTTRKYGGTGLGLTITKHIAELLGGSLSVTSEVDQGSVFSFRIATGPLDGVELTEHPVEEAASRHQVEKQRVSRALDARVLLVEDGPDNQRLISFLLRKAGAEVALADNGQVGMNMALEAKDEGKPFDVILMDMQMPVMDGYEATRRLRTEGYAGPIIALTAHAMANDRTKCLETGCDDFATKPINRTQLIEIVREYATQHRQQTEPPCETIEPDQTQQPESASPTDEKPPHVLIVDDDADMRSLSRRILERDGYFVTEAVDGLDALEAVARNEPDVIIMDMVMPHLDGLGCTQRLKANPATQNIPVIMVSAMDQSRDISAGLDAGADEYITKPIRPKEFLVRVRTMAQLKQSRHDLVRSNEVRGEQARSLTIIQELSIALASADNISTITKRATSAIAALTRCRRVSIMLPDPKNECLVIAESIGMDPKIAETVRIPFGNSVAGEVYTTGQPVIANTPEATLRHEGRYDSHLYASVPMIAKALNASEHVVGVLNITKRYNHEPFDHCDLGYIDLASNIIASVIEEWTSRESRDQARDSVVIAMATLAEYRDGDTGRHLDRVTHYATILAEELRQTKPGKTTIDDRFIQDLQRAMPLHDIGKVAIPDHILLKPGRLTDDEMNVMRRHAAMGAETLRSIIERNPGARFLNMAEEIAHYHHEWFDGNGYPQGIRGEDIPLCGRIAALADVYDALTTKRPYKEPLSHDKAKFIIMSGSGTQFDPSVVEAFLAHEQDFFRLSQELADDTTDHERSVASQLPHRIISIEHALLQQDYDGLATMAEELRKMANTCRMPAVMECAAALESQAQAQGNPEAITRQVRELVELCHQA